MKKFIVSKAQIQVDAQHYHNESDQNGEIDIEQVKDTLIERYAEELVDWLQNDIDWEQIRDDILEADRETREEILEAQKDYQEAQWKA